MRPLDKVDILSDWPEIFQGIQDFKSYAEAVNPQLEYLWNRIENLFADQFTSTATSRGIKKRESMLNITPMGSETLEDRRFRINARLSEQLPYTKRALHKRIAALCGKDGYRLEFTTELISVRVDLKVKNKFNEVNELVDRLAPLNMLIDIMLLYNTYDLLGGHSYRDLGSRSYRYLKEEVL